MNYTVQPGALPGPDGPSVLPAFVGGTMGTMLLPRSDVPIAAVRVPEHDMYMNFRQNAYASSQRFMTGDVLAMSHPEHGFAIERDLVHFAGEPKNPKATFRFEGKARYNGEAIVAKLEKHWKIIGSRVPRVCNLFRLRPAHVIGEISRHTEPGFIKLPDDCRPYRAAINYADLPADERLLLICELPAEGDLTFYRGLRVVPFSLLSYEFTRWQRSNTDVIEDLALPE